MSGPSRWGDQLRPSRWRLSTMLVASTVALFLVVTMATAALTLVALKGYLLDQLDQDVKASSMRYQGRSPEPGPGHDTPGPPPGGGASFLVLELSNGAVLQNSVAHSGETTTLSAAQVGSISAAQLGQASPKTVDLGGELGSYRLIATRSPIGSTVVTGLPMAGVTETMAQVMTLMAGGTVIGLVAVGAGGTWLVRKNLQPLQRVAHTATRVSRLKLDSGSVALAERVAEQDTDPRTEVGSVGLALNSMLDNVDGALRARHDSETRVRQFVADASHELRTPLASIRGYAELSRREREPVPASVAHALGRVESEAVRMTELVEDLLLLARLDAGRPLAREPVDLSMLAVDVVGDAHAAAPGHAWRLDLPEEPLEVAGDAGRLHQVVANLLANARTHTPDGTTVVTSIRPEGEWVRISVHDDGPGVPEQLQHNAFQRFTRGDDSRSRAAGSTGLGLSIVDAVTQAHGGRVELASRPGDTTFSVLLPA